MPGLNDFPSKPAPSVGSDAIDAEHGIQLGLLEAAKDALGCAADEATQLVEQLYTYTQAHFMSEQLLMRLSARPNYDGHQLEHEILLQELDAICSLAEQGAHASAFERMGAHEKRLLDHIRNWDGSIEDRSG